MEKEAQSADAVLMIRPARFQANPLTAESNAFQRPGPVGPPEESQARALAEFEALAAALTEAGVDVHIFDDTDEPHTPDAVFPNNWVSFHADGTVVLYAMEAPNRRPERRHDVIEALAERRGFLISRIVDLSHYESSGRFLEGTGSLVLDRPRRVAYACLSSRTHLDPMGDFAQQLDYDIVTFEAVDADGVPIYHTNVMMWIGEGLAAVCTESLRRAEQREAVLTRLADTGHRVIELSFAQVLAFAGNMLELRDEAGRRVLAMSDKARRSLEPTQRDIVEDYARIVSVPLDHIEDRSGGGVRCMLAAIHLPRRH